MGRFFISNQLGEDARPSSKAADAQDHPKLQPEKKRGQNHSVLAVYRSLESPKI